MTSDNRVGRPVGWLWAFAEIQKAGRGKLVISIGVRNLAPGEGGPLRHDVAREIHHTKRPKEDRRLVGKAQSGHEGPLWLTE